MTGIKTGGDKDGGRVRQALLQLGTYLGKKNVIVPDVPVEEQFRERFRPVAKIAECPGNIFIHLMNRQAHVHRSDEA